MFRLPFIFVFIVVTLVTSTAFAQDERAAQQYFEEGAAAYFEGKYAEALVQFKKAHRTVPNALFLYNIALCNVKLERYREALAAAQDARKMGGLGEKEATQNDARIASIQRVQVAMATSETLAEAREKTARAESQRQVEGLRDGDSGESLHDEGGFGTLGWIGVGAVAVGGGLLVGTLGTELAIQPKWAEYETAAQRGDQTTYDARRGEIEGLQQTGKLLFYSGSALVAIGATLIIVELAGGEADENAVAVHAGPARLDFVYQF